MTHSTHRQHGAALVIALLFLLLITLVATTGAETSTLQLQMAGNEQSRVEAQQRALAILDAILDDRNNTPVVGGIGFKICDQSSTDTSCDLTQIALDTTVTSVPSGVDIGYSVTRVGPLEVDAPSMAEDMASSASAYNFARQEITATYDGTDARLGRATVVQGVQVRIPAQNN